MRKAFSTKAFTLIELLIVVAIIAILAAIAVPNFLEAQTRAKISRAKADLRTLATGAEAYAVDHNKVPPMWRDAPDPLNWDFPQLNGQDVSGIVWPGGELENGEVLAGMSTPIAYISNAILTDPFVAANESTANVGQDEQVYTYQNFPQYSIQYSTAFWQEAPEFYGHWRAGSIGPDREYSNNMGGNPPVNAAQLLYDPTNGTISPGNIWRSQKHAEGQQPPTGNLLGAH